MYIASVTNDIESAKIIKSKLFGGKSWRLNQTMY
jgi:hypothetical protein